jgi:energy-coupling factor transporter transmembrane protein EcfT
MRRGLFIISLVFAVTLAIVFGLRVSPDALAVIVGVILGVIATVPTTALFTYLLLRARNNDTESNPARLHPQPPVVVINSGDASNVNTPRSVGLPSTGIIPQARQWTVIGDESDN